jgi:isoleucyl-tRNA synthetase
MKQYKEYKKPNFAEFATDIQAFWELHQVFEKSISTRENSKDFVFYEGPPSANGMPGIHHVMARTIKDIFCRYKTLKGFRVNAKQGGILTDFPLKLVLKKNWELPKKISEKIFQSLNIIMNVVLR